MSFEDLNVYEHPKDFGDIRCDICNYRRGYEFCLKAVEKDFENAISLLKEFMDEEECYFIEDCETFKRKDKCVFCKTKVFISLIDKKRFLKGW